MRCIALRQRSSVDLPQPDGPISAVTAFGSIASWMPAMIVRSPKPAVRSTTSMRRAGPVVLGAGLAERGAVGGRAGLVLEDTHVGPFGSGHRLTADLRAMSLAMMVSSRTIAIKRERTGPRAVLRVDEAARRAAEDLQRERGHALDRGSVSTKRSLPSVVRRSGAVSPMARATASITPVMIPARAVGSSTETIVRDLRGAERQARLADVARHEPQHLLGRAHDQRHHHERRARRRRRSRRTRTRRPTARR